MPTITLELNRELQRRGLLNPTKTVTEAGTCKVYKIFED